MPINCEQLLAYADLRSDRATIEMEGRSVDRVDLARRSAAAASAGHCPLVEPAIAVHSDLYRYDRHR